jgi:hypothetical protein
MNQLTVVGIDRRGNSCYAVRVSESTGRPEVHSVVCYENDHFPENFLSDHDRVVLSVPDDQVQVKSLCLNHSDPIDICERARFELTQSLLESESEFSFDFLISEESDRLLGLIYRSHRLEELQSEYGVDNLSEVSYLIRAAALGRGYLAYAREVPGELVALVDFDGRLASICLIYRRRIVELAHIVSGPLDHASEEEQSRLAAELRTVLNFKLATLANQGISLPLSELLLSGTGTDNRLRDMLQPHFPTGVGKPELNTGYFGEKVATEEVRLSNYLVALGLIVN